MKSTRYKPIGWKNESQRHSLAAKGVKSSYFSSKGMYRVEAALQHHSGRKGEVVILVPKTQSERSRAEKFISRLAEGEGIDVKGTRVSEINLTPHPTPMIMVNRGEFEPTRMDVREEAKKL